tara:strand:- start:387 stop:1241 length:855 start_codon:yes stop_codon:yes gene_type:complete
MKAIKKIEVNTKNKKSLSLTVKKWLEDYLKLQENILSFVVEVKQIKESKEYYLKLNFNYKPDADKNEYFDLLNLLTFDLSQKAIGRHAEEFKTLLIKDFKSLKEGREEYIILIRATLNKEISNTDPINELELCKLLMYKEKLEEVISFLPIIKYKKPTKKTQKSLKYFKFKGSSEQLQDIYDFVMLKDFSKEVFIKDVSFEEFQDCFSGKKVKSKMNWIAQQPTLRLIIIKLKEYNLIAKKDMWEKTRNTFIHKGKEFSAENISKNNAIEPLMEMKINAFFKDF